MWRLGSHRSAFAAARHESASHARVLRQLACDCVVLSARLSPFGSPASIGEHTPRLLRALLGALTHQHSRVRVAVLRAVAALGLAAPKVEMLDDAIGPLAQLAFDENISVREGALRLATDWILGLHDRSVTVLRGRPRRPLRARVRDDRYRPMSLRLFVCVVLLVRARLRTRSAGSRTKSSSSR